MCPVILLIYADDSCSFCFLLEEFLRGLQGMLLYALPQTENFVSLANVSRFCTASTLLCKLHMMGEALLWFGTLP